MHYKNKWIVNATHEKMRGDPRVKKISEKLSITLPTAQLLVNRGCLSPEDAERFLKKEEEQLYDPFLMKDMDKAAYRIADGIENGESFVIYGDYDVDGVTSVSSLYLYLKSKGAKISYYIPCRSGEGYGMSESAIKRLYDDGCNIIITVDTGITAVEEAKSIRELGMTLIVTDHHECHAELPEAEAIVNPRRHDCLYPFKELAGVGVVFKLICALETVLNPSDSMTDCVRRASRDYGDLVAIGTVADVMPIRDENRLIVSYGLSLIENTERPGLIELIEATRGESKHNVKRKITASYIGYTIAPRINAAGRIRDASLAVDLFLAEDFETAAEIAKELCDINRERQTEENKIMDQAFAKIDAEHDFVNDPVIVLSDEMWHHGIIGIVASRITEKYSSPSILISFEGSGDGKNGDDLGKGSGRSVKGMNLVDALSSCAGLLEKYGGHELAAGLTIKRENLDEFKRRLNKCARECFADIDRQPSLEAECELLPHDITMTQANELYYLEPYGVSNPIPVFVMRRILLDDTALVGGGKHTRLSLKIGSHTISAMCFRQTLDELDLYPGDTVDVMFTLDINEFQNMRTLQLIVKDIRLSESEFKSELMEREAFKAICNGTVTDADSLAERTGITDTDIIVPTHDDCAALYSLLRREIRLEHEVFSMRALQNLLLTYGLHIGYVKLRYILLTFSELGILKITELDAENEIYAFGMQCLERKTNLEKSNIYRKLKSDFGRKI